MLVLQIIFLLLQLGFVIFLFYMCVAFISGAPFVPTKNSSAMTMIRLANIKKGSRIYDLGSGNGKLLFLAAGRGARATGYEINPWLVLYTKVHAFFLGQQAAVKTYWRNFWGADISDADVIFVYLLPSRMEKLERKLKKELKKGALVVSNSFIFPNWKIIREDRDNHIYVFRV